MAGKKPVNPRRKTPRAGGKSSTPTAASISRLIVRFRDDVDVPHDVADVGQHLDKLGVGPWKQIIRHQPRLKIRSLFTSVSPARFRELVKLAVERDGSYRPPNFQSFCVVESPVDFQAQATLTKLRAWRTVRAAYFDPPGSEPTVNPADDEHWPNQGYLDPAPDGIDAEFAWTLPGGDGAGQDLVDLERGWTLNHEDLDGHGVAMPLYGDIRNASRPHGTAVLGEICALDNVVGCVGIAPNLRSVNVVSYFGAGTTRADAVLAAIGALPFGGVLLLEAQVTVTVAGHTWINLPMEVLEAEFAAMRLAAALGITVVEAAGNGGHDLDTFSDAGGNQVLNRSGAGFRDSGAIMVAAATATVPHRPLTLAPPAPPLIVTNFGSRIDCYGWGEHITTTDSTEVAPFETDRYTIRFGATSGAAPIVAGAALVVQGLAELNLGYRFSGWQMRALLTDPATSTPSNDPPNDRIGVMPDLKAVIDTDSLRVAPDVYVRDFVGDLGDPHTDVISVSPDVILRSNAEPDPQAAFGESSGTENSVTLGNQAEAGQDNYVYVRVRNRGGSDASNVTAAVYWSPPATLVTPDLWTPIGETVIPNVPSGRVLTVSDAIVWPSAMIPATGHYCLVGLIGNAADPAPIPADFVDWTNYERFIRANNNVTWHNFNVVDNQPAPGSDPSDYVSLAFIAPGAPDRARFMSLEVLSALPDGSRLALEIPEAMLQAMTDRGAATMNRRRRTAVVPLNPYGRRSLGEMLFTAKSRTRLRLLVHIPENRRDMAYEVCVRQLFENRAIGRLTWRLAPMARQAPGRKHRVV